MSLLVVEGAQVRQAAPHPKSRALLLQEKIRTLDKAAKRLREKKKTNELKMRAAKLEKAVEELKSETADMSDDGESDDDSPPKRARLGPPPSIDDLDARFARLGGDPSLIPSLAPAPVPSPVVPQPAAPALLQQQAIAIAQQIFSQQAASINQQREQDVAAYVTLSAKLVSFCPKLGVLIAGHPPFVQLFNQLSPGLLKSLESVVGVSETVYKSVVAASAELSTLLGKEKELDDAVRRCLASPMV